MGRNDWAACFAVVSHRGRYTSQHTWLRFGFAQKLRTPPWTCRGTETILWWMMKSLCVTANRRSLSHLGYRTISAPAAIMPGVWRVSPGKIDLLLTDVVMHPLIWPLSGETLMRSRPEMKVTLFGLCNPSLAPDGELKRGPSWCKKPSA